MAPHPRRCCVRIFTCCRYLAVDQARFGTQICGPGRWGNKWVSGKQSSVHN